MGRDVFYITTPIYYPNDVPHIGHAYNAVATDFIARFHRLRGEEVFHLTGTDEHGLKLQRAAEAAGHDRAGLGRRDGAAVARGLGAAGHRVRRLHPDHRGPPRPRPCRSCSTRSTTTARTTSTSGPTRASTASRARPTTRRTSSSTGSCPIHERPVERMVEENYFFRLSAYADRLLEHYERHPEAVEPETRRNEVLSTIRGGLQDFSISRTTFDWGIPLPVGPEARLLRLVRRARRTTSPPPATPTTPSGSRGCGRRTST